jgi:hypothetical protein
LKLRVENSDAVRTNRKKPNVAETQEADTAEKKVEAQNDNKEYRTGNHDIAVQPADPIKQE